MCVMAIAGGLVWHEQPSFCNALCHMPMDPYLPTYESEPGEQGTDKWGNEVEDAGAMLAARHRTEGATCLTCHVPSLDEQLAEGANWLAGDYYFPLEERSLDDLVEARGGTGRSFCMNESCHDITCDELAEATSDMAYNPHETHYDGLECGDCHKAHRASVFYCTKYHSDAEEEMPDGWVTFAEASQLEAGYAES